MNDDEQVPAIGSRAEFAAALRWGFERSIACGARRIVCVDPDFVEWPLDEAALHDQIGAWLRLPLRKLVLVASSYEQMPRCHPRFVAWRARWSHAVEAWSPTDGVVGEWPTRLLDDGRVSVQLFDRSHWRGRASLDERAARLLGDETDAVLQRSEPAFAVNHLGL